MSVAEPIVELPAVEPTIVPPIESIPEPTVEPIVEPTIVPAAMPNAELVVPTPPLRNPIRKSTRTSSEPTYLQAYHCNQVSTIAPPVSSSSLGTLYPLSSYLSYANLSSNHRHFCNAISSMVEPKHYDQAVLDSSMEGGYG